MKKLIILEKIISNLKDKINSNLLASYPEVSKLINLISKNFNLVLKIFF